jgi:hypothetical protein
MGVERTTVDAVGADQKQCYRVGGAAALVIGIGYVVIFPLYAQVGVPPSSGEAWFRYLPGKTGVWWAILALSVFTDFLFVPVAFALYVALKRINQNAMLLAHGVVCRPGFSGHLVALCLDPHSVQPLRCIGR